MQDGMSQAARVLASAKLGIAVTGAGASVESGIPDFRSPGGLWTRYDPHEYATYGAFMADPDKVWEMWYELGEELLKATPNPGHFALAELERLGHIRAVVTQNIDNLHFAAGSQSVIEYHGNAKWIICPACRRRREMHVSHRAHGAPRCECGGHMKPDVVLFGEIIPAEAHMRAEVLAARCDVLLVVGTSATVYPAAQLPYTAKENGAFVIECNLETTDFTRSVTDVFLRGPAGETLPALLEGVRMAPAQ